MRMLSDAVLSLESSCRVHCALTYRLTITVFILSLRYAKAISVSHHNWSSKKRI